MGFFSWNCCSCQRPVLAEPASRFLVPQASRVVLLLPRGDRIEGVYDGYGRVDDHEIDGWEAAPRWHHQVCFSGQSYLDTPAATDDPGQGFFYSDDALKALFPADWCVGAALEASG